MDSPFGNCFFHPVLGLGLSFHILKAHDQGRGVRLDKTKRPFW